MSCSKMSRRERIWRYSSREIARSSRRLANQTANASAASSPQARRKTCRSDFPHIGRAPTAEDALGDILLIACSAQSTGSFKARQCDRHSVNRMAASRQAMIALIDEQGSALRREPRAAPPFVSPEIRALRSSGYNGGPDASTCSAHPSIRAAPSTATARAGYILPGRAAPRATATPPPRRHPGEPPPGLGSPAGPAPRASARSPPG